MKTIRVSKEPRADWVEEIHYECPRRHQALEAILVEGVGPAWDGKYCLHCFYEAIIGRLAVNRVRVVRMGTPPAGE